MNIQITWLEALKQVFTALEAGFEVVFTYIAQLIGLLFLFAIIILVFPTLLGFLTSISLLGWVLIVLVLLLFK